MNGNNKLIVLGVAVLFVSSGLMYWSSSTPKGPGELDGFAQCITEKGAKFYGAFWCPHCKDQKRMFGNSVQYVPYIECSTPDGNSQTPECKEKGIQSYPTWIFSDGATSTGTLSLETLAEKTGCSLQRETSPAAAQ